MDYKRPTTQMQGVFQPWTQEHRRIFVECWVKTGQVFIMVRDVPKSEKYPFSFEEIKKQIDESLSKEYSGYYKVISVPNIKEIFCELDKES